MSTTQQNLYRWNGKKNLLAPYLSTPLPANFELCEINQVLAQQIVNLKWALDVFDSAHRIDDFFKHGFGFCLVADEQIISLCASYSESVKGIKMQVKTNPLYQSQGFDKVVAAYFIVEALHRHLTPVWSTDDPATANALGFELLRN